MTSSSSPALCTYPGTMSLRSPPPSPHREVGEGEGAGAHWASFRSNRFPHRRGCALRCDAVRHDGRGEAQNGTGTTRQGGAARCGAVRRCAAKGAGDVMVPSGRPHPAPYTPSRPISRAHFMMGASPTCPSLRGAKCCHFLYLAEGGGRGGGVAGNLYCTEIKFPKGMV